MNFANLAELFSSSNSSVNRGKILMESPENLEKNVSDLIDTTIYGKIKQLKVNNKKKFQTYIFVFYAPIC